MMRRPTRVRVSCPLTTDDDGCEGELVLSYTPGSPGSWNDPPEGPELDCEEGTCVHAKAEWTAAEFDRVLEAAEEKLRARAEDADEARARRREDD